MYKDGRDMGEYFIKSSPSSKVTVILYFRLWIMGGTMPLFSEQDNPASFSPYLLTRSVDIGYVNFLWYLAVWLDIFTAINHLYKITGLTALSSYILGPVQ